MQQTEDMDPAVIIANEQQLAERAVRAVLALLNDRATVPFIARYRKEATGGLDEVQIRSIEERQRYLAELGERRATILASIDKQGQLTDALRTAIARCTTKNELEDLYQPFKPKRRTRGQVARERGLLPLAERILAQPSAGNPMGDAQQYVAKGKDVPDSQTALQGAMDIIAEEVADRADLRSATRDVFRKQGLLTCKVIKKALKERPEDSAKFEQYFDFSEPVARIPAHRILAIRRGDCH